jgi:hypothetical protein
MTRYALAALALLVAMQSSLPAMAAQGGGRAKSCLEQCDRERCQSISRATCRQAHEQCIAQCR